MEININAKIVLQHDESEFVRRMLQTIECKLVELKAQGEHIMSQVEDLNAAIAAEDVEVQDILSSVIKVDADIDALIAKIGTGTPTLPDISAALTAIASHTASLTTAAQQMKDEDAKANTQTPPPVA